MVRNIHERLINAPLSAVGGLLDRLGSREDALWPVTDWPPMRFRGLLAVGTAGGHGPIRYRIDAYEPARRLRFSFTAPRGFVGTHEFEVAEIAPGVVRLRHTLDMRVEGIARLSWPLAFRPLHDALVEDAFDRAEAYCAGVSTSGKRQRWSPWVRLLRYLTKLIRPRAGAESSTGGLAKRAARKLKFSKN